MKFFNNSNRFGNSKRLTKHKLIIFDWSGTIIDYGCYSSVNRIKEVFKKNNLIIPDSEIRKYAGKNRFDHLCDILNKTNNKHINPYDLYNDYNHIRSKATWITGMPTTLKRLSYMGIQLASNTGYSQQQLLITIVDNKPFDELDQILKKVVSSDMVNKGKPYPYMIWKACERSNVYPITPDNVAKVGDTIYDIKEGKNANVFTIAVTDTSVECGLPEMVFENLSLESKMKIRNTLADKFYKEGADLVIPSVHYLPYIYNDTY